MEKSEITLKEARELYKNPHLKEFLLSKFTKEQLEARESNITTSFDDLIGKKGWFVDDISVILESSVKGGGDKNVYPSEELAEAALAQSQLAMHMREYNGDWVADYNDDSKKWLMYFQNDKIVKEITVTHREFLTFKTMELRDLFLENHRGLIEQYKPLA